MLATSQYKWSKRDTPKQEQRSGRGIAQNPALEEGESVQHHADNIRVRPVNTVPNGHMNVYIALIFALIVLTTIIFLLSSLPTSFPSSVYHT